MPLPAPGIQLVNLSHVEDLADMLALVPGKDAAKRQLFNLASGRAITHEGDSPILPLFHTMHRVRMHVQRQHCLALLHEAPGMSLLFCRTVGCIVPSLLRSMAIHSRAAASSGTIS